jgi:hypothetical protein
LNGFRESEQDSEQQESQPGDEAAEVVAHGGEYGVDGVAAGMGKVVAAHAVIILKMADHRLDGGAAFERALDLVGDAALLAHRVDSKPVLGRGVVAAVSGIGDDAFSPISGS